MSATAPTLPCALFVGIDIAAATLTAAWMASTGKPSSPVTLEQTPNGFTTLQRRLQATGVEPAHTLVVIEATSTYWMAVAVTLHAAGYQVSVINPLQAHHFAKAQLRRAKTDNVDAQDLAVLAAKLQPSLWTPPPTIYHEVRQRLMARDALLTMRQQTDNQRHALLQWPLVIDAVQHQFDEVIANLDERIRTLEAEVLTVFKDSAWATSLTCLLSIPGVGLITAAWVLVATVNFTLCDTPEAASAYAGLAPMPRESGTSVRGRPSIGHAGHGRLRTALYMATLSATRYNPAIKTFYNRLREAGKPSKVARCAAARKLLHLAWALVKKQQPFDPFRYLQPQQQMEIAA